MSSSAPREPEVTLDLAIEHGLNEEEFEMIKNFLGRTTHVYRAGCLFGHVE
jgi:phosphoribosylformylglycinamidine synthase subunit PurL